MSTTSRTILILW